MNSGHCPPITCGHLATAEDLERILRRYEGAVNECESAGDDSDEAVEELRQARDGLMNLLRQAKVNLP